MNAMLPMLSALAGVLILVPLLLWLLKRAAPGLGGSARGPMRLVASLALAPNQRLLTVEVGQGAERRWLVVGVTPAGMTTLHTLAPTAADTAANTAGADAAAAGQVHAPASFADTFGVQLAKRLRAGALNQTEGLHAR